eukprot:CAMPEP_0184495902 /NCGR_PEP_ID=MMETSP0113_2-20130426/32636_1 /TAXON_ID=91329 /ORGANISM="Norrisiella sphaerica, Strain BC52" /LENGTH=745 /DNA_ID=CAMNT_0026882311 /DNA_START=148 /DNA_END=2385 /DNA_ORIENTATION=-
MASASVGTSAAGAAATATTSMRKKISSKVMIKATMSILNKKIIPNFSEVIEMFDSPAMRVGLIASFIGTSLISLGELRRAQIAKHLERNRDRRDSLEAGDEKKMETQLMESLKKTPKTRLISLLKLLAFVNKKKEKSTPNAEEKISGKKPKRKRVPGVDMIFLRRLRKILRIIIPNWHCREIFLLSILSILLVTRSLLSVHTAKISGHALRCILEKSPKLFWKTLFNFAITGMFSSMVNSGLKFLTNAITTAFRTRLTQRVHEIYMSNRNYYKAAVLRTGQLDNPDQRVVEDLHKFCQTFSDLFSRTFKPALDVVVATIQMSANMGYTGPIIMYSYFLFASTVVRSLTPKFSSMIAKLAQIEGDFRRVHTRILQNAEEIAFLEGESLEKKILNGKLQRVSDYSSRYFLKQFAQGIFDQWAFKYMASCVGLPIIVLPFLFDTEHSAPEIASNYFTCNKLIQQASGSFAELLLVYKKFQKLAGFTARVMGLIEALECTEDVSADTTKENDSKDRIGFENVSIYSPDGRLLIKDLNMDIKVGVSLMITGINGAGKTSMFRVLSGLWKAKGGVLWRPMSEIETYGKVAMFYMPQNPYLVTGTLRDQITYPLRVTNSSADEQITKLLNKVGLQKLLKTECRDESNPKFGYMSALNVSHHDWSDVLSGGEKQRVGWARLYFHKPKFAILDESTSAINPDEECKLYEELCKLNVTFFSIAHRLNLRRFHQKELSLAGDGTGAYTLSDIRSED